MKSTAPMSNTTGERGLRDDERCPQTRVMHASLASAGAQTLGELRRRCTQRRHEAREQSRDERRGERKQQDAPMQNHAPPVDVGHEQSTKRRTPDARGNQRRRGRGDGEQRALCHQQPNQSTACNAKRETDGDLTSAIDRAREQQVDDVSAGDQEHQDGDAGETCRHLHLHRHLARASLPVDRAKRTSGERVARPPDAGAPHRLRDLLDQLPLAHAHSRAYEDAEAVDVRVLPPWPARELPRLEHWKDRRPNVGGIQLDTAEVATRNADDRVLLVLELERLADYRRIGIIRALPECFGDDGHRHARRDAGFFGGVEASEARRDAEKPEVARFGRRRHHHRRVFSAPDLLLRGISVQRDVGTVADRLLDRGESGIAEHRGVFGAGSIMRLDPRPPDAAGVDEPPPAGADRSCRATRTSRR
jgi:hypothetical protein